MATLHLVFSPAGAADAVARAGPDDTLVLLQDGVYTPPDLTKSASTFVLEGDATARGMATRFDSLIDYARLVELVAAHQPVVSWR